jgi:hypothetical protein
MAAAAAVMGDSAAGGGGGGGGTSSADSSSTTTSTSVLPVLLPHWPREWSCGLGIWGLWEKVPRATGCSGMGAVVALGA